MVGLTLHSLHIGGVNMDDAERKAMRDQIVWLTQELEKARRANQDKTDLLRLFNGVTAIVIFIGILSLAIVYAWRKGVFLWEKKR